MKALLLRILLLLISAPAAAETFNAEIITEGSKNTYGSGLGLGLKVHDNTYIKAEGLLVILPPHVGFVSGRLGVVQLFPVNDYFEPYLTASWGYPGGLQGYEWIAGGGIRLGYKAVYIAAEASTYYSKALYGDEPFAIYRPFVLGIRF